MSREQELLKSTPLFDGLSDAVVARFVDAAEKRTVRAGQVIIAECTQIDQIYLVLEGEVNIEAVLANADQELEIASLSAGDFFALFTFLEEGDQVTPLTATAKTDVILFVWDSAQWRKISDENSEVGYQLSIGIARILYKRLFMLNQMLLANVSWGLD